jgi:hypothetical protein
MTKTRVRRSITVEEAARLLEAAQEAYRIRQSRLAPGPEPTEADRGRGWHKAKRETRMEPWEREDGEG